MELETKKAGMLELQPVNQQALLDIILDMGGMEAIAAIAANTLNAIGGGNHKIVAGANRAMTYCLGWGVTNEPPPDAIATLEALGKPTNLPEIARANWLRYLVLADQEASDLITAVMKLTFEGMNGRSS